MNAPGTYDAIALEHVVPLRLMRIIHWLCIVLGCAMLLFALAAGLLGKASSGGAIAAILLPIGFSILFFEIFLLHSLREPTGGPDPLDRMDFDTASVLYRAGAMAQAAGAPISSRAIAVALMRSPAAALLWSRAGIDAGGFAQQMLAGTTLPQRAPIPMPPTLQMDESATALMKALPNDRRILLPDILVALCNTDASLRAALAQAQLSPEDIEGLAHWVSTDTERVRHASQFWTLDNLLRRPPVGVTWVYAYTPHLDAITVDLTAQARSAPDDTLVGRDDIVDHIERVLSRTGEHNTILVGPPGIGKRAIVRGLAHRIALGTTLPVLQYKRVLSLDASTFTMSEPKGIEQMLSMVLNEAADAGNIILFVDNIHTFLAPAGQLGTLNATEPLKRLLALPSIQVVATTDPDHFNRLIRPQADLMRLWEPITVAEPTVAQTLKILERELYAMERGSVITTYAALKEAVQKADLLLHDVPFPEKAIALVAEIIGDAQNRRSLVITVEDVDRIISSKTNVPVGQTKDSEREKLEHLSEYIHRDLVNQESAVQSLSQTMLRLRAGITSREKPAGAFLFAGPTGVGKTSAAKALAKAYFGSENAMIRFDMSEYQAADAVERFIGSQARSEPGQFTTKAREMPFAVLLLDEIEKAHTSILNLLLQVLDEARLTDAMGKVVTFHQHIIIATSNAGSEFIREMVANNTPVAQHKELLTKELLEKQLFRPEFLNRFDDIIVFHPLTAEQIAQVARMMLQKLADRLAQQQYLFTFSDELVQYLARIGFDPQFGARPMQRALQNTVEVIVSQRIVNSQLVRGTPFTVTVADLQGLS